MMHQHITADFVPVHLDPVGDLATPRDIAIGCVIYAATKHGVEVNDLRGRRVYHRFTHARQEAYALIRDALGWSYPKLGRYFGRHHTSIMQGVDAHRARCGS